MEKELDVKITAVTGPATIKRIAEEKGINPQNVFVRVNFEYEGKEYSSSNQLRFFKEEGYQKLLEAKKTGEAVNITLRKTDKGDLMYLNLNGRVEVSSLFDIPLAREDNRSDISELLN